MKCPNIKSSKFPVAPEGEDIFLVDSVEYVEAKNTIKVTFNMQRANRKHSEKYRLDVDFQVTALGNMLRAAYNDSSIDDINEDILTGAIGRQFTGDIVHREWNANTYAGINAFTYRPVEELSTFVKTIAEAIQDNDPVV